MSLLVRRTRLAAEEPVCDVRLRAGLVEQVGDLRPQPGEQVLGGGALLPGFVDGHLHLSTWAASLQRVDVAAARTAQHAAELVQDAPAGSRTAYGFRDALWPDLPHKDLLQVVLPGRPVALFSADLHTLWLSPAMLAELGLEHPTGVVRDEEALGLLAQIDADRSLADVDAAVQQATRVLAGRGTTAVLDFEYADNRTDWLRRVQHEQPLVRVSATTWTPWLARAAERTGEHLGGHDRLRAGPLKVMVDGSLNTRTAACHDPYPDARDGYGQLLVEPEQLVEVMSRAWAKGIATAAHAIGDRATSVVLDAFERVGCSGRVEHAQQVHPRDLPRLARPGLVVSVQPQHAVADRDVADRHWPARSSVAFGYGSLHHAGARLQLGSDAPVSPPEPLAAIADAVRRTDDDRPPWHPEQALPLAVALRAACGGRDRLRVGDVADVVLLAEHPALVSTSDLRRVPVLATALGGELTHLAAEQADSQP